MLKTTTKIELAKFVSQGICIGCSVAGLSSQVVVTRDGLKWDLDLREGIDLAIYLFGMFERETVMAFRRIIQPGDIAFDIGANIGAHTLQMARSVGPSGKVVAFEPTQFAFTKLTRNVRLNPDLEPRMVLEQVMLDETSHARVPDQVYSSWPLTGQAELHEKHCGQLKNTLGARVCSVDDYMKQGPIQRVNFMKIDVDGHECDVLRGARVTLGESRPVIVMELAPYVMNEGGSSLEDLCEILASQKYSLTEMSTGRNLPLMAHELTKIIPDGCGINVMAMPIETDAR